MKLGNLFHREDDHVCPWWLAYTFDNPLRRLLHDPDKLMGSFVSKGMTVADIGCGMGYFSLALAKMVGEKGTVFAVDLQQKMLDIMRKRADKAGVIRRIHPVLADENDIKIKEQVDFILLFWMVHEVRDIPRFFTQVSSVLKPGCKVLYAEPKVHVSNLRFKEILQHAQAAGLKLHEQSSSVRISRSAVLSK